MFERFTERARQVVVLAQEEARTLKHDYVGTEHLLLGLLREEEGLAAKVLESLGVKLEDAREQIEPGVRDVSPPTMAPARAFDLALREALSLGHNYIGTEHILLGLVRDDCPGMKILTRLGQCNESAVRAEVMRMLSGPKKGLSTTPPERPYRTNENVKPSSLEIARALATLAKDHLGKFTYDHGFEQIVIERDDKMGITAQFFTCKT